MHSTTAVVYSIFYFSLFSCSTCLKCRVHHHQERENFFSKCNREYNYYYMNLYTFSHTTIFYVLKSTSRGIFYLLCVVSLGEWVRIWSKWAHWKLINFNFTLYKFEFHTLIIFTLLLMLLCSRFYFVYQFGSYHHDDDDINVANLHMQNISNEILCFSLHSQ